MTLSGRACRIVTSLRELAPAYDVALCDVWGVVHDGRRAFADATDALARFRQAGGTVVLLTNAPRPEMSVQHQIDRLGVPRSAYDRIVTSGDATVALVAARGPEPAYHIGPARDLALLDEVRRTRGFAPRLVPLADAAYVLCTGLFDDRTETPDDYDATLRMMLSRDLPMICANPDIVVHIGTALTYCGGAVAERYESGGGRVLYAGKPHAPIYDVAVTEAAARRGGLVDRTRVLAIGDGLRTDIAGADRQGFDSLFVTTGIHRDETLASDGLSIDPLRLHALLDGAGHRPIAAMTHLVW